MVMKRNPSDNTHRHNDYVETQQLQASMDRMELRTELELTRTAFQTFLTTLSAGRWHQKSPNCDWTMVEIAVHLTWALEQLPKEIASARRGQGMFNSPKLLDWLSNKLSYWMIRGMARKATPESIRNRYDNAMTAVLQTMDKVKESEWVIGASFYGHGFYSIADLFHTPAEHFAEHTSERKE